MKNSPLIALLTDFGAGSPYIASMKGEILKIHKNARILDISHTVSPFNITEAAYILWSICRSFEKGTIFVVVVDPGVGSNRKILLAESSQYKILAPDNGILRFVYDTLPLNRVREVTNKTYFSKTVSPTFHGRDIFAPVAAHLAAGVPASRVGPEVKPHFCKKSGILALSEKSGLIKGEVIYIDAFGNIITNISLKRLPKNLTLKIGEKTVRSFYDTYAHAPEAVPFFLRGSSQLLEIAIKRGNAASTLKVKVGQKVNLRIK